MYDGSTWRVTWRGCGPARFDAIKKVLQIRLPKPLLDQGRGIAGYDVCNAALPRGRAAVLHQDVVVIEEVCRGIDVDNAVADTRASLKGLDVLLIDTV